MNAYSWTHLADHAVDRELPIRRARDRAEDAVTLSLLAEFDARKRFVPAGYSSMHGYCMGVLGYSEDVAYKVVGAARVAREFPVLFHALADGRMHRAGVLLLGPKMTAENVEELLDAAAGKSKAAIEAMLAERFPKVAMAAGLPLEAAADSEASDASGNMKSLAPGRVISAEMAASETEAPQEAAAQPVLPRTRITPLSAEWFTLHGAMSKAMREKLARAKELLGHVLPSGDAMAILEHALDVLVARAERKKFGTTSRPRASRASKNVRTIPAAVRREVSERDGRQCTFVSESGHRCEERAHLQYDHVPPIARGGASTAENLRLLCRAHNQYAAEQVFGPGFMQQKREQARPRAATPPPAPKVVHEDVIPYLRALNYSLADARAAAEQCDLAPETRLEERVKWSIRFIAGPWFRRMTTPAPGAAM